MSSFYSELADLARLTRDWAMVGHTRPRAEAHVSAQAQAAVQGRDLPAGQLIARPGPQSGLPASAGAARLEPGPAPTFVAQASPVAPAPGAAGSVPPAASMGDLAERIRECSRCPRCKSRNKAVPGVGPARPVYLVVADAPCAEDDLVGLPFTGSTGQFFDKWLEAIGMSRYTDTFITTLVKCRDQSIAIPGPTDAALCGEWLDRQIELLRPVAALVLGESAAAWFAGSAVSIDSARQQVHQRNGLPWVLTWHPAEVLRNPDLKRPVWQDLKYFKTTFPGR